MSARCCSPSPSWPCRRGHRLHRAVRRAAVAAESRAGRRDVEARAVGHGARSASVGDDRRTTSPDDHRCAPAPSAADVGRIAHRRGTGPRSHGQRADWHRGPRHAAHLPRRGARRRQDVGDARRGSPACRRAAPTSSSPRSTTTSAAGPQPRRAAGLTSCRARRRAGGRPRRGARPAARPSRWSTTSAGATRPARRTTHRWQDVEALLDAGIDVVTTLDIGQLDVAAPTSSSAITGVAPHRPRPRPVRPPRRSDRAGRHVARRAAPPPGPRQRVPARPRRRRAGQRVPPGEPRRAARDGAAVDGRPRRGRAAATATSARGSGERIVVALTGAPGGERLIRRAARIWRATHHGDARSACTSPRRRPQPRPDASSSASATLLDEVGGTYREVIGDDVAAALAGFVAAERATQLVLGASPPQPVAARCATARSSGASTAQGVAADLHVVADDRRRRAASALPRLSAAARCRPSASASPGCSPSSACRCCAGLLVVAGGHVNLSTVLLFNLALVDRRRRRSAGCCPGSSPPSLGVGLTNWFLTPPAAHPAHQRPRRHRRPDDLRRRHRRSSARSSTGAAPRAREAGRARAEAPRPGPHERRAIVPGGRPPARAARPAARPVRRAHGDGARPHRRRRGRSPASPASRRRADPTLRRVRRARRAHGDHLLVARRRRADRRRPRACSTRSPTSSALGLEARRLRHEAADRRRARRRRNELRTALLRAVSHDLRTPLASIKASVSRPARAGGVRSPTPTAPRCWPTIDGAADRLDRVIGNLLDMSRLQAGAIQIVAPPDGAGGRRRRRARPPRRRRRRRSSSTSPRPCRWSAPTAALLERAVGNVVSNAIALVAARTDPSRVEAAEVGRARRAARRRPWPGHPRATSGPRCSSRSSASATARTTPAPGSAWRSPAASSRPPARRWSSTTRPAAAARSRSSSTAGGPVPTRDAAIAGRGGT